MLEAHLPTLSILSVTELGDGSDHIAYEVNSSLVVRLAKNPDPDQRSKLVRKEAQLLRLLNDCSPPSVPNPVAVIEQYGVLVYPKIAGLPLIDARRTGGQTTSSQLGTAIGPFLTRLHRLPVRAVSQFVPREQSPVEDWFSEAKRCFGLVAQRIPPTYRARATAFLAAAPPSDQFAECLCHNDLGVEHVLVHPTTGEIVGIIDWSDAAITDPARDFGLILRDLGHETLDFTLLQYPPLSHDRSSLRSRALFYARCSLLDDLEYGLRTGRHVYVEKSMVALSWLFPA